MNGLLSTASPWQNDSTTNSNAISKKRIPSLSICRNKTIKKNIKQSNTTLDDINDLENEDTIFNIKENFQTEDITSFSNSPQNTIESIQQDNQTRTSRVQQLINSMNIESDGQDLANFKPIDYSSNNSDTTTSSTSNNNYIPVKPLYSMNEQPSIISNPYSSYRDVYLGDSKMGNVSYTNPRNSGESMPLQSDKLMEKINRMLHILEEQQFEPTKHITEEFILYTFLGIFVIYIVDSFTRAGKYIR